MTEGKIDGTIASYAEKIELLSATQGDPEEYYNEFKNSLKDRSRLDQSEEDQTSFLKCGTPCFNPGFIEFLWDSMRHLVCCILCPCCMPLTCWDFGRGFQPDQNTKNEKQVKN